MPDKQADEVPEFAHLDKVARRRELAAAGANANQKLDALRKSLKMPNLISVETEVDSLIIDPPPRGCVERVQVALRVAPNQSLQKVIVDQYHDGERCVRTTSIVGIQFMGYGPYTQSFLKDVQNTNPVGKFFRDVAAYGVNLHRTMVFAKETWEGFQPNEVIRVLVDEGAGENGTKAWPNPDHLANLKRMVQAAAAYGIVVQVCPFVHHSVVSDGGTIPPLPVKITGTHYECYQKFFNVASPYLEMQEHLIDKIVETLLPHWNVVYEIGNELRVPLQRPPNATYGEANLKAWIEWAARRIRSAPNRLSDNTHLITTSTGAENAPPINRSSLIQFCSFHHGQWAQNYEAGCQRAIEAGDKHVVFDDDGDPQRRPLASVVNWAKTVLNTRGGCRVSFNHKGSGVRAVYDPNWINQPHPISGKPIEVLTAFREGRAISTSPCARA